jgi:hypothetical protein
MLNSDFVKVNLKPKKGEPIHMNQFSDCVTQTYKSSNLVKTLKSILKYLYIFEKIYI